MEALQHSADRVNFGSDFSRFSAADVREPPSNFDLRSELEQRTARNTKIAKVLGAIEESVALGDVRCDRGCRSRHLRRKGVAFLDWEAPNDSIDTLREVDRLLPDDEVAIVMYVHWDALPISPNVRGVMREPRSENWRRCTNHFGAA